MAREVARDEVIERMDDGIVVLDGAGRVLDLNLLASTVAAGDPRDLRLLVDGRPERLYVVDAGGRTWIVFAIDRFSARTVRLASVTACDIGDSNLDGRLTSSDATLVLRKVVGLPV